MPWAPTLISSAPLCVFQYCIYSVHSLTLSLIMHLRQLLPTLSTKADKWGIREWTANTSNKKGCLKTKCHNLTVQYFIANTRNVQRHCNFKSFPPVSVSLSLIVMPKGTAIRVEMFNVIEVRTPSDQRSRNTTLFIFFPTVLLFTGCFALVPCGS